MGRFCKNDGFARNRNLYGFKKYALYLFLFGRGNFLQIVGSLLLLLGYKARMGTFLLIIFLIPASLHFHNFWTLQGPDRPIEQMMFMKDMATLGGLFAFAAMGPGKFAFDR